MPFKKFKLFLIFAFLIFLFRALYSFAAELLPDNVEIVKAKVFQESEAGGVNIIPDLNIPDTTQIITAQVCGREHKKSNNYL